MKIMRAGQLTLLGNITIDDNVTLDPSTFMEEVETYMMYVVAFFH